MRKNSLYGALSSMRASLFWISLLPVALGLASCAKDRTAEDARADQLARDKAAADAVTGTYRGALVSNGQEVAGISVHVEDQIITMAGSGSDTNAQQQVVMSGHIEILTPGQPAKQLTFERGSYLPRTQSFSVSVPISSTNGNININGSFGSDSLSGTINADSNPATEASFNLELDGALPAASSLSQSEVFGELGTTTLIYSGKQKFQDGQTELVTLMIKDFEADDPTLSFYNFFLPTKNVEVAIVMPSKTTFSFTGQKWDVSTGILLGHATGTGGSNVNNYDLTLNCNTAPGTHPSSWNCSLSNQMGLVFSGVFKASAPARARAR